MDRQECLSYMKSPALNNAGLSYKAYSISLTLERLAELFSGLFFVAASRLNSPRLFRGLLKHRDLVLSSTSPCVWTTTIRLTVTQTAAVLGAFDPVA